MVHHVDLQKDKTPNIDLRHYLDQLTSLAPLLFLCPPRSLSSCDEYNQEFPTQSAEMRTTLEYCTLDSRHELQVDFWRVWVNPYSLVLVKLGGMSVVTVTIQYTA